MKNLRNQFKLMYLAFPDSDMALTDIPVGKFATLVKANVNPSKDFLVATRTRDLIKWKIFDAP